MAARAKYYANADYIINFCNKRGIKTGEPGEDERLVQARQMVWYIRDRETTARYNKKNRLAINKKVKQYDAENRERKRANGKRWREKYNEYDKERQRKYLADNKEELAKKKKEYRENNKDKVRKLKQEYYKRNSEKCKQASRDAYHSKGYTAAQKKRRNARRVELRAERAAAKKFYEIFAWAAG